ncbi:MAG: rhomboid family intramembrane serine protease [Opitutales bacterium]|nr:rhomboid family intramembrane serine protease [Opitutales bacterium]
MMRVMASLKVNDTELDEALEGFETPEGLVAVALHDGFTESSEVGLAILAIGEAYWTLVHEGAYVICVDQQREEPIRAELAAYELVRKKRLRPLTLRTHEFRFNGWSFVAYCVLLIAVFSMQGAYDLASFGRVDAVTMIDQGQWWRAVTALTLHADIVHLVSNLVAGMGFAFFVARFFGAFAGWGLIFLSGCLGNLLNAWVYYPDPHFSIGASTAVFGALGLLTGIGVWVALAEPDQRWTLPRWLVPVFGGFTLLGLIGVGDGLDGLVDVAAHISGFLCGLVLGLVGAIFQRLFVRFEGPLHYVAGLASLAFVGLAWWLALL